LLRGRSFHESQFQEFIQIGLNNNFVRIEFQREAGARMFCCAHCAHEAGENDLRDRK